MSSLLIRNIDPQLWRQFKAKAALEGISIKDLIERLIRAWVQAKTEF